MTFFLMLSLFFFLLPILVVWFGNHDRLSNGRFSCIVGGFWIIGFIFLILNSI